MSDNSDSSSGGIGFCGALGLLFIGLKLGNVINWSWWLVLLPLYGPAAFVLAVIAIAFLICAAVDAVRWVFS